MECPVRPQRKYDRHSFKTFLKFEQITSPSLMHAASYLSVSNSRLNRVVFVSKQGNKLLFFDVITDALEAYIVATTLSR